ncbi:MAG: glycosyltransferase family 39 protein [Limnohabitans sp.]|nr:glycosyltransferase family 39 protein [Limnohabitans sp.]
MSLLLVLAALRPLALPDEGRYGEIGRWMLISGDWLTPRLNAMPFFHKPPLLHWLQAISLSIFGIHPWALRVVPAIHAALMLSMMYAVTLQLSNRQTAIRAVWMLGTSLTFMIGGQYINHDMLVATLISIAIWCFALSLSTSEKSRSNWGRLGFVACALGMLSKGLIGVVLPGMVIFLWLILSRQFKKIIHWPWISGVLMFLIIVLPWFVLSQQKFPNMFDYMFIKQQVSRYTATDFNNPQKWWFYLQASMVLMFPWFIFSLASFKPNRFKLDMSTDLKSQNLYLLCWIWVVAITVFFSISNSKLYGYILPIMPALAVLASMGWESAMTQVRWSNKLFIALCLFNITIAIGIVTQVGATTQASRSQDVAKVWACAAKPTDTLYVNQNYPYDLPFYAQTQRPMVVVDDWEKIKKENTDGWELELLDSTLFEPQTKQYLQALDTLALAGTQANNWLIIKNTNTVADGLEGWKLFYQGAGWRIFKSSSEADSKSPPSTQHISLSGCNH